MRQMIKRLGNLFWLATVFTAGLGVLESDADALTFAAILAAILAALACVLAGFPWKQVSGDD
ncbi:hypothetical protein N9U55_01945 [Luminiphilus sp.]|nr:hypothetical protein [Luminiphilus sp.]MDA9722026.1 hypothetical protein [Luminiphilus sp.]